MAKVFESDLAEKFIELVVGTNLEALDDITLANSRLRERLV